MVGWESLANIMRYAADVAAEEESQGALSCPNDGEPLVTGPDGKLFCPFDGWRPV